MTGARPPVLACPAGLVPLLRQFIAEESTSALRHDIRNKLSALRNAGFYVRRRLEQNVTLLETDPRLGKMLAALESEAEAISELLVTRLLSPDAVTPSTCDADEVLEIAREADQSCEHTLGPVRLRGNGRELQLALFCLLENAVEAEGAQRGEGPRVRVSAPSPEWIAIDVQDEGPGFPASAEQLLKPFHSGWSRTGLGLNIARRAAERWGGRLELLPGPRGRARLQVRAG